LQIHEMELSMGAQAVAVRLPQPRPPPVGTDQLGIESIDRLPVGLVARALPRLSVGLLAGELALKPLTPTGRGLKR
jgi:hypothetical protein